MARIIVVAIALLSGAWMSADGVKVLLTGSYFGPEELGPWARLVRTVGIDPYSMGLPFLGIGLLWIAGVTALFVEPGAGWWMLVLAAVATLWYAPLGTFMAIAMLALLLVYRAELLG